ncbi:anthranilate synthase component I [Leptospira gomenensis]|uniref:Anthranilate synthase component 1 n=1 Tax=Leptospira gomenensis TaxID=2484974 RepID=A0A5F1Z0W3_9LEPT|nr:anthranilate synthase component I [Leptospira gomenensis]TGK33441.1 anthranilate synthase component I [Leptospira gomenensis]TGK44053.1 anthranilate synthase component I [Leptospira gomenensis]TGK46421.1 anthranilate synthase component I [Leptospira gomenensis]TGK67489.1 anthranilate synthase component I [Leptospira gomenensis]
METPVSLFAKWGCESAKHSFLLESVEGGEKLGRNSFLGKTPHRILQGRNGLFYISEGTEPPTEIITYDPLVLLENLLGDDVFVQDYRLPPFAGGAVGFLSYSAVRYYENIPDTKPEDENAPDCYFAIYDELLVVDHIDHVLRIVVNARTASHSSLRECYEAALRRIDAIENEIRDGIVPDGIRNPKTVSGPLQLNPNIPDEEYKKNVERAKEYIKAGDIFQVVPSRKVRFKPEVSPFQIYRGLRTVNPSPYMYFLRIGEITIVGSSPEIMVKYAGNHTYLRPIAGTRPRGKNSSEDKFLEENLLSDPKEIAEHIMLVDLGRNDLGRVCKPGSVRVNDFKVIEKYSHVMHIVSQCSGELDEEKTVYDLIRATLPAGTVSGAPKIRAMEIIDELETTRRAIYSGALGYISFSGESDLAIIIRTIVFYGDEAFLQAGGGVVYDSVPESELEETKNKMAALLKAVEFARNGLKGEWK